MTLKSFPRGGKKPDTKPSKNGLLFNKKDVVAAKPKKNRGRKDHNDAEPRQEDKSYVAKTAECLNWSNVGEGMVLLGRVQQATEYDMIVTLPGRLSGRLQVTDVSEAYTNLLQTIVKSQDSSPTEFKPLSELYKQGEYVICYVKSVDPTEKWRISLSLEPELINRNLDPSRLCKGSKISGTISSVEDHGYVVDTGIDNLRSFLGLKDVDQHVQYYPGKQVFCAVKSVKTTENSTTAKLSTKAKHVATASREDNQSLDALVPGTKLVVRVENVLSNGLQVSFNKGMVGYVNRIYLDKCLTCYERGDEISGTLMYVMPTVKFAYFTLLPSEPETERLNIGDTLENARVQYTGNSGVVMSLKKGIRGLVPFRRTDVAYEKIAGTFPPESIHKCRVIAYDSLERVYVCTMEREILKEKHFGTATLNPGDVLDVEIARIQPETGYVMVTAGRTRGWVAPEHVRDLDDLTKKSSTSIKVGDIVKARVLGRDQKQSGGVLLTLKKSLIESHLPVLKDMSEAKVGSKHHGTIVQINGKGLLVSFYDRVKGLVAARSLDAKSASTKWNFIVGQTIVARIEEVKVAENRLMLSVFVAGEKTDETDFDIGEAVEGTVVEASVEGIYVRITKDGKSPRTGFLPAGHVAPCQEVASYLSARYASGDTITALVFATSPRFVLTRTFVPQEKYRDFKSLKVGDCLPCSIHELTADAIKVLLPVKNFDSYGILGNVGNTDALHSNQLLFAKVASIDRKHKKIRLTLDQTWQQHSKLDTDLVASIDVITLHLNKLRELSEHDYYKSKGISEVSIGARVSGIVDKVTDHGLVLKLDNGVLGTVRKDHYKGKIESGDKVNGSILWVNYIHELVEVTLLPSLVNVISTKQNKLSRVTLDTQLRGDIVLVTNWFALVVLRGAGKGSLAALPTRRHINDIEPDLSPYAIGKRIRCYIVLDATQSDLLPICLVKSSFEVDRPSPAIKIVKRKSDSSIADDSWNKIKKRETTSVEKKEEMMPEKKMKNKSSPKVETKKVKKLKRKVQEIESNVDLSESNEAEEERVAIPECGFFWDNKPDEALPESSSDDDDEEDEPKQKRKKKLSASERRELEREKEREIREREESLASNEPPNSVHQFDRLVLSSPDSSMIWLQYMAYHLQATEIEKARAVAKRAIKSINFREETERLNVWQAWLNLESRFGSCESLESVYQEAVRTNDALKIHIHMLTVHAEAARQSQLEKTITTIIGKFKNVPQVWLECGSALLKMGLKDKSRHMMQRALQSLPPQEHVNVMVKFAQMEMKLGDKERAQTLLEQVVTCYPKRVDVWSSYVDVLVKCQDIEGARKVLERTVVQSLPARKMKTLFKKFIAFEQAHGSPEGVSHVQQLALKYVENQQCTD